MMQKKDFEALFKETFKVEMFSMVGSNIACV